MSNIKDAFLNMLADCEWSIEYDGDTDSNGRIVDCSTFTISGSLYTFKTFLEFLDIKETLYESLDKAIIKAMETPPED